MTNSNDKFMKFCEIPDAPESRNYIKRPVAHRGKLIYTNGNIALRVNKIPKGHTYDAKGVPSTFHQTMDKYLGGSFAPGDEAVIKDRELSKYKCTSCDGSGTLPKDEEEDCDPYASSACYCLGSGVDGHNACLELAEGVHIAFRYLKMIFDVNGKIFIPSMPDPKRPTIYFTHDEGDGVLMCIVPHYRDDLGIIKNY